MSQSLTLSTPLTALPGVGPARQRALTRLGLETVADLLAYFPRDYEDRTVHRGIASLPLEELVCFAAMVAEPFRTSYVRRGMELTRGRIVDGASATSSPKTCQPCASSSARRYLPTNPRLPVISAFICAPPPRGPG